MHYDMRGNNEQLVNYLHFIHLQTFTRNNVTQAVHKGPGLFLKRIDLLRMLTGCRLSAFLGIIYIFIVMILKNNGVYLIDLTNCVFLKTPIDQDQNQQIAFAPVLHENE